MLTDHDADVAREKEVGQRRERVRDFVQRARDRATVLECTLDHERDKVFRRQRGHLFRERVGRDDLERARREEFSHFRPSRNFDQRVAHFMDLGEAFQHRDQPAVFALRDLEVDDVVVQIIFPCAWSDGD